MKKLGYLDSLRGLAILGVIIVHVGNRTLQTSNYLSYLSENGKYGVQLFFIVSAFTLFLSADNREIATKQQWVHFFIRRFFRIAPMFYLALIVYSIERIFLDGMGIKESPDMSLGNVLGTLSFIGNGFVPDWLLSGLVPGGWSITNEMIFYLLFPLIYLFVNNIKKAFCLVFITSLIGFTVSYFMNQNSNGDNFAEYLYYWAPNQISIFALGILGYHISKKNIHRYLVNALLLIPLSLFFVPMNLGLVPTHFIFGLLFMSILISISKNPIKILNNKYLVYIGKISFSMYLTQFLVRDAFEFIFKTTKVDSTLPEYLYFIVMFVAVLAGTILLSSMSYKLIEKPGINLGQNIIGNMKILYLITYAYHRFLRSFHRRKGEWQTAKFEYHHHQMKHHRDKAGLAKRS